MTSCQSTVFVVDDDPEIRNLLHQLISSIDLPVETFSRAKEFLDCYHSDSPGCLIADLRMPDMSGLDLQNKLIEINCNIPVIFLSGYGDVPTVVRAMKAGAIDFLEKPFDSQTLLDRIQRAVILDQQSRQENSIHSGIFTRISKLTCRERQVFDEVVSGLANKQIAGNLQISEKTVEAHRARVMSKMEARSLAGLVKMAMLNEQVRENHHKIEWKSQCSMV